MKISVIIPVYNVERWISRCVKSLMEQTLRTNVEFIFVDDASTDHSIDIAKNIIKLYPERVSNVKFIRHEINQGLPTARNTGMSYACGKYIYHCDSDDFLEPEMLNQLITVAEDKDADMVYCDWFLTFNRNERWMRQPKAITARMALSYMLDGSMKYNVWNKLVRKALYIENSISFPDGYSMGEDMTMMRLAVHARNVVHVNKPLYHYVRVNDNAMSRIYDDNKLKSLFQNVDETVLYLRKYVVDNHIEQEIAWFLLNVKFPFLFTGTDEGLHLWRQMYRDVDNEIFSNKSQTLRSRILQWCAAHDLTLINKLYSWIIYNIIYGKIYR